MSVTPGELDLTASWDAVEGAASYRIGWRRPTGSFAADDQVTTTDASAAITTPDYGQWVVRVEGCNDAGCGPGVNRTVTLVQTNRPPALDDQADNYAGFVETGNAPRGILVSKLYDGIFSDPDGDTLTYTVSVPADRSTLVDTVDRRQ